MKWVIANFSEKRQNGIHMCSLLKSYKDLHPSLMQFPYSTTKNK